MNSIILLLFAYCTWMGTVIAGDIKNTGEVRRNAVHICSREIIECPEIDGPDSLYEPLEDCTKFCQCSNGIAYVHNCSSGLHFNPVLNVCDYPDRAGCDGGAHNESSNDNSNQESGNEIEENGISANGCQLQCPDIDGPDSIYGPLEDCTKFCQCSNGIAHVHNCSSGLHFNPVLNVCDYPDRAGCDGGTHNESGEDNSNQESENAIEENGISTNGCQLQCPDIDGPDSIYGPLEDCTKFCQCSNGIAYVHNCSSGLHFNPVLNVCDYPDRAGCDGGAHNESSNDNSNQESGNEIEENGISTNGCQLQCPDIDGPDSIYGPLEDCTKFCQCSNGIAYVHNCSSGLHFNPVLNVCDYPDRAGCDGGTHNESEDNSNQESGNEIEENGISANGCQLQCPDIDGPDSIYGPLEDCTKFCQCSNGIAHVHNCSSGLHFNPVLNVCDYPDRAGCDGGTHNESGEDNSNQESGNEIEENGISANGCQLHCPDIDGPDSIYGPLEDCTKFCQCSNGIAYVHNCSSGLHFNPVLNVCDYPDRAGCDGGTHNESGEDNSNQESENEIEEDGISTNGCQLQCPDIDGPDSIYGPLEDCTKFCQCSNGIAHVHNCSSGLHFNPVLNVCDYPDRAGCYDGSNSNGCELECPEIDGPDSIYGPSKDCSKFCQCSNGIAYVHNCPSGLHFNPILNVCDYPDSAQNSRCSDTV